jgi:hypothetical protein
MKLRWLRFRALVLGRVLYKCRLIKRTTAFRWETALYVHEEP